MATSVNFGNLTDVETVQRHRASFDEKITKMQEAAFKNSKFLTRADQDRKVARLLALNNVGHHVHLHVGHHVTHHVGHDVHLHVGHHDGNHIFWNV